MKAWTLTKYGTINDVALADIATPNAGPGEVLVRVRGAALNPADLKVISGRDGGKFLHAKNIPFALGYDFSGEIESLGPGVAQYQVGDQVFGFLPFNSKNKQGSLAEYVAVPEAEIGGKPPSLEHPSVASTATTGLTALQGLRDLGGLASGQRVLINGGSGGVGSYAVQLAKHAGAEVWATCSAQNKDYVSTLGAHRVIDYRATPLDALARDVEERFDIVFDAASMSSYSVCAPLLTRRGTYLTLLPSLRWATGKLRTVLSSRSCRFVIVKARRADFDHLAQLLESGELRAEVAETYGFADVPTALRRLADGHVQGKLAVTVDS